LVLLVDVAVPPAVAGSEQCDELGPCHAVRHVAQRLVEDAVLAELRTIVKQTTHCIKPSFETGLGFARGFAALGLALR
jgi:hypothetical protein